MFYAIKFLADHPLGSLPFLTKPAIGDCVFHTLVYFSEEQRKGIASEAWVTIFRVLQKKFPEPHHINHRNEQGLTPLHYATVVVFPELVRELLESGADPTIRDNGAMKLLGTSIPMSVLDLVLLGSFLEIPSSVLHTAEHAKYLKRREEIKEIFSVYIS
jgi:hypothetical protein